MTMQQKFIAALVLGFIMSILAGIEKADPVSLGISVVVANWIPVILGALGVLMAGLPALPAGPAPEAHAAAAGVYTTESVVVHDSQRKGMMAIVAVAVVFIISVSVGHIHFMSVHPNGLANIPLLLALL